jgi:Putative  PD-(D/E)XK family member, (DUF4420)
VREGTPEWFLARWATTKRPSDTALEGLLVSAGPPRVFTAVGPERHPHLLIEIDASSAAPTIKESRALRVVTDRFTVGSAVEGRFVDLQCDNLAQEATFAALAADVLKAVAAAPKSPGAIIARTIERWRAFWAIDPGGLRTEEALGLFGELWFLERWLGPVSSIVVDGWAGPDKARHDFQSKRFSVEIKASASRSSGGVIHGISTLDQLDEPAEGELLLFSLHATDDALAKNTLPALIARIRETLEDDAAALEKLDLKLAAYGYSPAHDDRYGRTLRVIAEQLYRVGAGFPRLLRSSFPVGLPAGISDVTYRLSIAACAAHLIAGSPGEESWQAIRDTLPR